MKTQVSIVLDCREAQLKQECSVINLPFVTRQLPIGDILFRGTKTELLQSQDNDGDDDDKYYPLLIIERKTMNDFYSSIISGRFREQRERLLESNIRVLYILENHQDSLWRKNDKVANVISGALENMALKHKIHVLSTVSVTHTAKVLNSIMKKIEKGDLDMSSSTNVTAREPIFVERKDKTMSNIQMHQLSAINGVSPHVAKVICDRYPTLRSLTDAYDKLLTIEEKNLMLADVSLGKKKLGKVLSKRISNIYN